MVHKFRKWLMVITLFVTMLFMLFTQPQAYYGIYSFTKRTLRYFPYFHDYTNGKWRRFSPNQMASLSNLGQIVYLDYSPPFVDTTLKNYTILTWKYGPVSNYQFARHLKQGFDPLENCSVKNCRITYKHDDIETADLVLFLLSSIRSVTDLPNGRRNPQQIWTFLTNQSPYYTFRFLSKQMIQNFNGLFNWSMTYRMDSDIPVPFGRTIALRMGEKGRDVQLDTWSKTKKQDVLVAIMMSNCFTGNRRRKYVIELQKHIPVDIYGRCGTMGCSGYQDFNKDCDEITRYKFYLAFENSDCDEYITEKVWWNAFEKNVIPIVMGGSTASYRQILPPNSYINVEKFANPKDLAYHILYLNNTPNELLKYFSWTQNFKVLNEHGYFQTNCPYYCRICEALNYNSRKVKIYHNLTHFWNSKFCRKNWIARKIPEPVLPKSLTKVMNYFQKRFEAYALFI